ncbi:MAG: hypothetical protein IPH57_12260 [Saprospiraceae bacterium]|nr:hypothetical protein [Saprospiraceae bacterium]
MKSLNLNVAASRLEMPVMTILDNKSVIHRRQKMIKIYVEDFNNHPISYANVKLTSGDVSTTLKYDRKSNSYVTKRFAVDRYDLEVTADHFEPNLKNMYIPKFGIERTVVLAKS